MKLDKELADFIFNVVKTSSLVGVDRIIIEPGLVRSMSEDRTVGVYSNKNVPDLPNSFGLRRIQELQNRFTIAKDMDEFTINIEDNGDFIGKMIISAKGLKIDYRCADPSKIASPRVLKGVECYKVKINEEAVKIFQKGLAAMNADEVSIVSNNGVSFEFADLSHDIYKYTFAKNVELMTNEDGEVPASDKFVHRYSAKTLLALFKNNPEAEFTVDQKGMLRFPLNDLTVFVFPTV